MSHPAFPVPYIVPHGPLNGDRAGPGINGPGRFSQLRERDLKSGSEPGVLPSRVCVCVGEVAGEEAAKRPLEPRQHLPFP